MFLVLRVLEMLFQAEPQQSSEKGATAGVGSSAEQWAFAALTQASWRMAVLPLKMMAASIGISKKRRRQMREECF